MPKITIPDREVLIQDREIRADRSITAAAAPGNALAQTGRNLQAIGEDYERRVRIARISNDVSTKFTDTVKSYNDWFVKRSSNADQHKTLVKDFHNQKKLINDNAFKDISDPDVKRILTGKLRDYFTNQQVQVTSLARNQEITVTKNNAILSIDIMVRIL